jgi:hypothetical protein
MESWLLAGNRVGGHTGRYSKIQGSSCNCENKGKTDNLWWILYSAYDVLGVCCTQC